MKDEKRQPHFKSRLCGSTLIETLVAMTIVTVVLMVAWLTIGWVLSGSFQRESIEANLLMSIGRERIFNVESFQEQFDTLGYQVLTNVEAMSDDVWAPYKVSQRCVSPTGRLFVNSTIMLQP